MARGVTVAVVGAAGVAGELGKKGSSSDITLFNTVRDGHAVTLVEPTQFPERLPPLVTALAMADRCLLVVQELNRALAETIATLELSEIPTLVVVGPSVGEADIGRLLKGGRLESVPRMPLDLPALRGLMDGWGAPEVAGPVRVPLDHAFPVKGVGAVALGVVRQGTLRAHDRLRLWPTPKPVEVRSIQVHDEDRKEANCGERVGAALKGVEADEIARGQILAPEGTLLAGTRLRSDPLEKCRYYRGDASVGAHLHLALGLQVVPVVLEEMGSDGGILAPDRPVAFGANESAVLIDLDVPIGPRVLGRTRVLGVA
ncbi:MAG TPA: EF-Tu/IF-2/RF-3 family GTPase [Thermoplasmata archaeon]|nr:EF-Tu/IF-2/RF-3 family GTPase [Thermoplasmata archaeon]